MMKKKFIISFFVIFFICISKHVFSAEYKNYEWGMTKNEAIKKVEDNGYKIIINRKYERDNDEAIAYKDSMFGEEIKVSLVFTPISKKLFAVLIDSEALWVGEKLKPILEKKYGKPVREGSSDYYKWIENGIYSIILRYDYMTTVVYNSKEYASMLVEEERRLK